MLKLYRTHFIGRIRLTNGTELGVLPYNVQYRRTVTKEGSCKHIFRIAAVGETCKNNNNIKWGNAKKTIFIWVHSFILGTCLVRVTVTEMRRNRTKFFKKCCRLIHAIIMCGCTYTHIHLFITTWNHNDVVEVWGTVRAGTHTPWRLFSFGFLF